MNKKIKVVISVAVVLAVALTVWHISYPEQKESVEIGFSTSWPVEKADIGIKVQNKFIGGVPVINFEYNNHNYTTLEGERGLTAELKKEPFDDLLECAENGRISQAHATAVGGKVFVVYVLIDNGQPYFSTEKLIDIDSGSYEIILEKKGENKTIVHFKQSMLSTLLETTLATIVASFAVMLILLRTRHKA